MASVTLDNALARFAEVPPHFGPGDENQKEQVEQLRRDLKAVSRSSNLYFNICVVLVLVLFVVCCAIAAVNFHQPKQITVLFSATGLSFFGVVRFLLKLWREKVNSDMLLVLAGQMDAADLRKIVQSLLKARLSAKA